MTSLRPERNTTAWIGIALTLISAGVLIVSRFIALEKADETKTKIIADLKSDVADLRREREGISRDVVEIKVQVRELGKDMGEVKTDVKEIHGKLTRRR